MTRPHGKQVREAARLIARGASARSSTSAAASSRRARRRELRVLAELTGIPVVTTLMARGAFPDSHPQHLGMPGMHGTVAAVGALQKADLLISPRRPLRRPGDRQAVDVRARTPRSSTPTSTRPRSRKNRTADVPIVGDCREVIADLVAALQAELRRRHAAATTRPGGASSTSWRDDLPARLRRADRRLARAAVRHRADRRDRRSGGDLRRRRRPAPDVGGAVHPVREARHLAQLRRRSARWATPCRPRWAPRSARPDATVWAIDGDGCFQMTNQELATCAHQGHPDQGRGHQQRQPRHGPAVADAVLRRAATPTPTCSSRPHPRLREARRRVRLRRAARARAPTTSTRRSRRRWRSTTRPVVVDFVVHQDAMVWPMVAAGTSNDDIKVARDLRARSGTRRTER